MDDDDDGFRNLNCSKFSTYIERLKGNRAPDRWHSGYHVFDLVSVHFIASILLLHFNI